MVDAMHESVETNNLKISNDANLFDVLDGDDGDDSQNNQSEPEAQTPLTDSSDKEQSEPKEWYYADKIKGEGMPPEWFNHKTFKNITEQARAYNEARKQITQYSEKLKAFSGAPEQYEDAEDVKNNVFAVGLKELGKKIGLNQSGFNELFDVYNKAQEIETEKTKNILFEQQKEELKKIGGVSKLKEIETRFIDAFGDSAIGWLKKSVKSYDDYINLERIVSSVSGKTRLPINSVESSVSTREQAEELIRDPRWGKDRDFTKKADKLLGYMLQK